MNKSLNDNLSLFGIGLEFKALSDLANDIEFDEETGEVFDNSEILTTLFDEIETTLAEKLDNTNYVIKALETQSDTLKAEAKRLTTRANAMANKAAYLKGLMLSALKASGQDKLKTEIFTFSVRKSKSVAVADVENLPREYVRLKREADKNKIKEALNDGLEVEGCYFEEKESIGVR